MGKQYECQLKRKRSQWRLWKETNPEKYAAYLEKQRLVYATNPERAKRKRELMRLYAKNRENQKEKVRLWRQRQNAKPTANANAKSDAKANMSFALSY